MKAQPEMTLKKAKLSIVVAIGCLAAACEPGLPPEDEAKIGIDVSRGSFSLSVDDGGKIYSASAPVVFQDETYSRTAVASPECFYCEKLDHSLSVFGENLALDIGGGKQIIVLLTKPGESSNWLQQAGSNNQQRGTQYSEFGDCLMEIMPANPRPQFDFDRNGDGYRDLCDSKYLPYFVTFDDPSDPSSIRLLDPYNLEESLGRNVKIINFRFGGKPLGPESSFWAGWLSSFPENKRGDQFPDDVVRTSFVQHAPTIRSEPKTLGAKPTWRQVRED